MNLPHSSPIVLFVDDEPLIRKYFERAFGRQMNVRTAGSYEEARTLLANCGEKVAVLITDQRMPYGDGVLLLSAVKADYPHIVRMLTTAYADVEDAIEAVNQGEIWRYITKPWNLDELRASLESAMEVYQSRAYEQALLMERRRGMLMVASYIAHEMRTPLRTIHSAASGIDQYLPTLLAGHDWAVRSGADVEPVTKRHRQVLEDSLTSVQRVADRANTVIDLLLANAGAYRIDPTRFERCDMTECITVALQDFPFTDWERAAVIWKGGSGFYFQGSINLMILVLHNLLRNALQAVAAAGRGDVEIWTDTADESNGVHIRDTGTGIDDEIMSKIFDDFTSFALDQRSAGIGLGFCRKVMTSFGGRIKCHSEKDRYTQFDLWLPTLANDGSIQCQDEQGCDERGE